MIVGGVPTENETGIRVDLWKNLIVMTAATLLFDRATAEF